jgi:hypothetical protein
LVHKERLALWQFNQEGNVLLAMSFILSWNFIIMDEDWLQKYEGLSVRLQKA